MKIMLLVTLSYWILGNDHVTCKPIILFLTQPSITREKGMFMTFDQSISDCVIFLIFSFWVHFADFSSQSSGLHQRWTSHRLLLWVLDYLLFFLAWILLSMESQRHRVARWSGVVAKVAFKTVPCLPESNAARKLWQWNTLFLGISTMLELKWNIQAFKTIEESYSRAWITNLKLSEEGKGS